MVPVTRIPRPAQQRRALRSSVTTIPPPLKSERNARRLTGAEGAQEFGEQLALGGVHRPSLADRSGRERQFHCLESGMSAGASGSKLHAHLLRYVQRRAVAIHEQPEASTQGKVADRYGIEEKTP